MDPTIPINRITPNAGGSGEGKEEGMVGLRVLTYNYRILYPYLVHGQVQASTRVRPTVPYR